MQGGQRLKLPPEATEIALAALADGSCVVVNVGNFQETLVSDGLPK